MEKVAIVGARSRRQGTGEYIARALQRNGCNIRAIVGTSRRTLAAAQRNLEQRYRMSVAGYLSLEELLRRESVDIVAICSPPRTHLAYLQLALEAGCHALSEKPLWWPGDDTDGLPSVELVRSVAVGLVEGFVASGCFLGINTQWPFTLTTFRILHPRAWDEAHPPQRFSMWLSPMSLGHDMVIDSGSHLLSMLGALAGPGAIMNIVVRPTTAGAYRHLELSLIYRHARGDLLAELRLDHCPVPPRPAGYSINDHPVERRVELPQYDLSLEYNGARAALADPLEVCVRHFVQRVRARDLPDAQSLIAGMTQLHELVAATTSAH